MHISVLLSWEFCLGGRGPYMSCLMRYYLPIKYIYIYINYFAMALDSDSDFSEINFSRADCGIVYRYNKFKSPAQTPSYMQCVSVLPRPARVETFRK